MGRFLGIIVKRLAPCRYLNGHVKEPYEMSMAWEPDCRSNFLSPPAHLCAVTCITEISSNVTLSNQSTHPRMRCLIREIVVYLLVERYIESQD